MTKILPINIRVQPIYHPRIDQSLGRQMTNLLLLRTRWREAPQSELRLRKILTEMQCLKTLRTRKNIFSAPMLHSPSPPVLYSSLLYCIPPPCTVFLPPLGPPVYCISPSRPSVLYFDRTAKSIVYARWLCT